MMTATACVRIVRTLATGRLALTRSRKARYARSGPHLSQGDGLSDLRRFEGLTQFHLDASPQ